MTALFFDPWAALEKMQLGGAGAAKAAKVAKVDEQDGNTLAALATLAGGRPPNCVSAVGAEPANDQAPKTAPPPADPADLLAYIRDTLHCRVTLTGETVTIRPDYRCPPPVVAAVLAVLPTVKAILQGETEAPAAAGDEPTEAAVLALAERLAANPVNRIVGEREPAMAYFRAEARRRLAMNAGIAEVASAKSTP